MEYLFSVYWKDIEIGSCSLYRKKYLYLYDQVGLKEAKKLGFDKLIGFPITDEIYVNNNLFPIFESRIMSNKRISFNNPQEKIDYLIKTEGKLVTDNISIKKKELEHGQHRI